jgi:chemotaxis protein histidine kinase CheA/ActR/RegA family two-component response regulator
MSQNLKKSIHHIELPLDQLCDQDPEIREIFIEEVQEILDALAPAVARWIATPSDKVLVTDIRRAFHTLKGSGRMTGALQSAELAWAIEDMLNRVIAGNLKLLAEMQALVAAVTKLYAELLQDFMQGRSHQLDLRYWIVAAHQLCDQGELCSSLAFTLELDPTQQLSNLDHLAAIDGPVEQHPVQQHIQLSQDMARLDTTLLIFLEECNEHLHTLATFLHLQQQPSLEEFNQLLRALHTIRGSSGMVEQEAIFNASSQIEHIFKGLDCERLQQQDPEKQLLLDFYDYVSAAVVALEQQATDQLQQLGHQFAQSLASYQTAHAANTHPSSAPGLVAQLLQLDIDELLDAEFSFVAKLQAEGQRYLQQLIAQSSTLQSYCSTAQTHNLRCLTGLYRQIYQALLECPQAQAMLPVVETVQAQHQFLIDLFDGLASGQNIKITPLLEEEFAQLQLQIQAHGVAQPQPVTAATATQQLPQAAAAMVFDPDLLSIFLEESDELINHMDQDFAVWEQDLSNRGILQQLFRYLHTLKGGANMIQASQLGLVAHELESLYERILAGLLSPSPSILAVIRYVQDSLALRLQRLREERLDPDAQPTIARLQADLAAAVQTGSRHAAADDSESATPSLSQETVDIASDCTTTEESLSHAGSLTAALAAEPMPIQSAVEDATHEPSTGLSASMAMEDSPSGLLSIEAELLDIFVEEASDLLAKIEVAFTASEQQLDFKSQASRIAEYLQTLRGGAETLGATHLGQLAQSLHQIYAQIAQAKLESSAALRQQLAQVQQQLHVQLQQLATAGIDADSQAVVAQLQPWLRPEPMAEVWSATAPAALPQHEQLGRRSPLWAEVIARGDAEQILLLESYLEEANEQLTEGEALFAKWTNQRHNRSLLLRLQRNYHTLKGNARMVNQSQIASMANHLEYVFEQFALHQFTAIRYDDLIRQSQNWLRQAVEYGLYEGIESLNTRLTAMYFEELLVVDDSEQTAMETLNFDLYAELNQIQGDGSEPPAMYADEHTAEAQPAPQELIRISANLVEKMIDLSGESAINRSRIELDLGQMNFTLVEMELAILRLADQLRRMEGELESQILSKHEVLGVQHQEFDLLEMDQYSSLNQLSKSLAESASDLIDFKDTLADKIRGTETLLLQQSRLQHELQQNLMGTRLVPFSRLSPRLQRLVRQLSTQLNRPVDLQIENTEGELDRTILEKLVSPIEHMLRNAVDHGIEDQSIRLQSGKASIGTIRLTIASEGHDILVILADDGRGIDVEAVRHKALKNNLITADIALTDDDLMQYIFHSGFSTAQKITQISGRGVGLDVVQNEIKALGGQVSVSSELGRGCVFTIRVPTTVSVSDALMVKVGDQQFALPLAQIERIVRVSPSALRAYYASHSEDFILDGQSYRLRYLGEFIYGQRQPELLAQADSVPVIIYQVAGRAVALQVDQLIGSRVQIVVKPIGLQLSTVGYLGGATILADGRVCLIIDGAGIARRVSTSSRLQQQLPEPVLRQQQRQTSRQVIMVVDDSVTVRKVTSRLLERHGFEVITAKDGVDALEKLGHNTADLMLLDIEMPRMDGFELLNVLRHDRQHLGLPIVMITSRTGEKHRERAFSLGVNRYMGKPFQETDLIDTIQQLLAEMAFSQFDS